MVDFPQPDIRDLAVIGDKGSCALIDKMGSISWYCPWRFDQPSLFSLLVDIDGGHWSIRAPGLRFEMRDYQYRSAILLTDLKVEGGSFQITDFMPRGSGFTGICRIFSPAPVNVIHIIRFAPDYNRTTPKLKQKKDIFFLSCKNAGVYLKSSHPIRIEDGSVILEIPAGSRGWAVLLNEKEAAKECTYARIMEAKSVTEKLWEQNLSNLSYEGVYRREMWQSFLAIQLVTHEYCGGIIAAATTSLPEVPGGSRNYDYRYVWLRDTAMVMSALIRTESSVDEADNFFQFLCRARDTNKKRRFVPFYDLDGKTAPDEVVLPGSGYRNSRPLRMGNNAFEQLQLDAQGNILLAAKQIYDTRKDRPHWKTVEYVADYIVDNWSRKDHGIWEEHLLEHFTSSKVLMVKGLEFIADYAKSEKQRNKWLGAAATIRKFIDEKCMTSDGCYAVYAGSEEVDITACLFPVWLYEKIDAPVVSNTIDRIEKEYKSGLLYRRRLEMSDSKEEGVFLAGCLWMAQYYVMADEPDRAKVIIDEVLRFSTDLGFLPEEGDTETGELLGNFPQTFVHASLMGVLLDYNKAISEKNS